MNLQITQEKSLLSDYVVNLQQGKYCETERELLSGFVMNLQMGKHCDTAKKVKLCGTPTWEKIL